MSLFDGDDFADDLLDDVDDDAPLVTEMTALGLDSVDLAKVDPCPGGCGRMVRRMGSVPIGGSGLDTYPSGPWWCSECIQAKCSAAYAAVRPIDTTPPLD